MVFVHFLKRERVSFRQLLIIALRILLSSKIFGLGATLGLRSDTSVGHLLEVTLHGLSLHEHGLAWNYLKLSILHLDQSLSI